MQYSLARYEEAQSEKVYRIYVTDALRCLTENTAKHAGGSYVKRRYYDVILPQKAETRSGEEIKEHMKTVLDSLA